MAGGKVTQPDVTLLLDMDGVIREVSLAESLAREDAQALVGRPWDETIADSGGEKVRRLVDDARGSRVSVFRQVTQRFPSGLEVLMEYMTVRLGGKSGLLAIGRNLQTVAELQSRLIAAQHEIERDYWKLRDVETRYRLLFNASNEAVFLLKAADLRVIEANPAAIRALGLDPERPKAVVGRAFLPDIAPQERERFEQTLSRLREQGRAPGVLLHLGHERQPWLVRPSLLTSDGSPVFVLQLTPVAGAQLELVRTESVSIEDLIERGPDAFCVLDRDGVVLRANRAFLDLVQVPTERAVRGERLGRWLGRPGADATILLGNAARHGTVRLFATTVQGDLGGEADVEISAVGSPVDDPRHFGVVIRDVGRRLASPGPAVGLDAVLDTLSSQIGKTSLRKLVKDTVAAVERHYVEAALELTRGNRTAAAEVLGVSRQSLYAKLGLYGLAGVAAPDADAE